MINFSFEAHELYIPGFLDNILMNIINEGIKKYTYNDGHVDMPSIRVMLPCGYNGGYKNNEYIEYFVVQFDYNAPNMHIIIMDTYSRNVLDCVLTYEGYDVLAVKATLKSEFKYTERRCMIINYIIYIMDRVVNMLSIC